MLFFIVFVMVIITSSLCFVLIMVVSVIITVILGDHIYLLHTYTPLSDRSSGRAGSSHVDSGVSGKERGAV